jgi:hypothetical protein
MGIIRVHGTIAGTKLRFPFKLAEKILMKRHVKAQYGFFKKSTFTI